jgi:hypothetical protein
MAVLERRVMSSSTPSDDEVPNLSDGATLTALSVAYRNSLQAKTVKLSKKARKAARQNLKPFGMSNSKKPVRPVDPSQNNPNNYNIIIPQGQGPL